MELKPELMDKVIKDLEGEGADVMVVAYVNKGDIDYTIKATFDDGPVWEVVEIKEEIPLSLEKSKD